MAYLSLTANVGQVKLSKNSEGKISLSAFLIEKQGYYSKDGKWINNDNKFFASMFFDKEESAVKVAKSLVLHENFSFLLELASFDKGEGENIKTFNSLTIKEYQRIWPNTKKDSPKTTQAPTPQDLPPAPHNVPLVSTNAEVDF